MFRFPRLLRRSSPVLLAGLWLLLGAGRALALVGSASGTSVFNGLYINQFIGAEAFYAQGFYGDNAIVANIEAGWVWNGQETLTNVSQYFYNPAALPGETGQFDWHATMVGQTIAGNGLYTYQDGIAPGATLWSSAIATTWDPETGSDYSGSFEISDSSFLYGYEAPIVTGVNGKHAQVINSSWGFSDPTGSNVETVTIDALLAQNNVVGVFAAGNAGPGGNSVVSPGAGFNGITVAALTSDTTNPAYGTVADFSSAGPNDFYNPVTGITTPAIRPVVDIAAPGDDLTLAFYGGLSGGHTSGTDPTAGPNSGLYYASGMAGTSFAAPIVAGAAALMVDAANTFGNPEMEDARVIKAALLTGATKPAGWNNGQTLVNGVIQTTQALDYSTGAGILNLNTTYGIYVGDPLGPGIQVLGLNTTAGLPGLGGGDVLPRGWDLGQVSQGAPNDYHIFDPLTAGELLTTTVTWFADRQLNLATGVATDVALDNLALQVWFNGGSGPTLVAQSDAPVSTVQHLSFALPASGVYTIRVVWENQNYNTGSSPNSTTYGLAWNVQSNAVPEPGSLVLVIVGVCAIRVTRRRPFQNVDNGG
jgi:hypothetical protein